MRHGQKLLKALDELAKDAAADPELAKEVADRRARINAGMVKAHLHRAEIYIFRGDAKEAQAEIAAAPAIDPENADVAAAAAAEQAGDDSTSGSAAGPRAKPPPPAPPAATAVRRPTAMTVDGRRSSSTQARSPSGRRRPSSRSRPGGACYRPRRPSIVPTRAAGFDGPLTASDDRIAMAPRRGGGRRREFASDRSHPAHTAPAP
jgi:hypothetical protein